MVELSAAVGVMEAAVVVGFEVEAAAAAAVVEEAASTAAGLLPSHLAESLLVVPSEPA